MSVPKHWLLGGWYPRGLIVYQQRYRHGDSNKNVDFSANDACLECSGYNAPALFLNIQKISLESRERGILQTHYWVWFTIRLSVLYLNERAPCPPTGDALRISVGLSPDNLHQYPVMNTRHLLYIIRKWMIVKLVWSLLFIPDGFFLVVVIFHFYLQYRHYFSFTLQDITHTILTFFRSGYIYIYVLK